MPQFSYKARRRTGEVVQGVLDGADRSAALVQIQKLGLFPVAVEAARGATPSATSSDAGTGAEKASRDFLPASVRSFMKRKRKPKLQELGTFTQQLANLLQSGMPLTVALNSMTHLETKGIPAQVSRDLRQDVMEGKGLSEAMARQPVVFSPIFINMVRAGEQSGALVEVLRRMADHFQRFAEVQSKFVSAMMYPLVVVFVGIAMIVFFMTFMLPRFMKLFVGMNIKLPFSTQLLLSASDLFSNYWWLMILGIVVIGVIFARFRASAAGRRTLDRWKMSAPIIGKVVKLNLFGQFARTLGTLLKNGVPVLTALKITEDIVQNVILKEAIARTREEVTDGKTIAQPLASSKVFPQLLVDLVKIGEETGDVPGALYNLAETYEGELSIALRVMTNLIEPIMIIGMALGVGFLLLSVLQAMLAITSGITK